MRRFFVRIDSYLFAVLGVVGSILGTPSLYAGDSHPSAFDQAMMFKVAPLVIDTQDGRVIPFNVELANSSAEHRRGLMFREHLDENRGMLFDYHVPRYVSMWMKNTLIPLDMLFVGADGRVVHIAPNTTPKSTEIITAPVQARYVLEIVAGSAKRLNIGIGDRLHLVNP